MIIDMITFVVVNDIYDYHDYSAYELVTKAINHIFGHSYKCHSHNGPYHLQLYIYIYIYIYISYYYIIQLWNNDN
jgi:hypothetical protein